MSMKHIWIERDAYDALKNGELALEANREPPVLVAPTDSVWFAENVVGVKLLQYQKKLVRSLADMKNLKVIKRSYGIMHIVDVGEPEPTLREIQGWRPISEYKNPEYDWVLLKIIEPNGYEWIPRVAEQRRNDGIWHNHNSWLCDDDVIDIPEGSTLYFFDMQQLDKDVK